MVGDTYRADAGGLGLLIKGLIRFCAPKLGLRMMARVSVERSWEFQMAGAGLWSLPVCLAMASMLASRSLLSPFPTYDSPSCVGAD
jgi:hypothetical protein